MKSCSTLVITEMQIETTVRYISISMFKIRKDWPYQILVRSWENWNSHILLVGMYNGTTSLKTVCNFLKKLNIHLWYDPAIPPLGISQEKGKHMFTQKLAQKCSCSFICNRWKRKTSQISTNRWVDKQIVYIDTMK